MTTLTLTITVYQKMPQKSQNISHILGEDCFQYIELKREEYSKEYTQEVNKKQMQRAHEQAFHKGCT